MRQECNHYATGAAPDFRTLCLIFHWKKIIFLLFSYFFLMYLIIIYIFVLVQ